MVHVYGKRQKLRSALKIDRPKTRIEKNEIYVNENEM